MCFWMILLFLTASCFNLAIDHKAENLGKTQKKKSRQSVQKTKKAEKWTEKAMDVSGTS